MVQTTSVEHEGRNNTLSIDLLPKIRPKSHSFMSSKDVIFKKNIKRTKEEIAKDSEISKSTSFDKSSSLANLSNRPKTSSFLRDLRKLFSRSKTSINATTTIINTTLTGEINSRDNTVMRNGMENLNNFDIELREKSRSRSWSHYEAQGIFHKYQKPSESKPASRRIYSSIRALRKNGSVMNQFVTENTENKSSIHSKEFSAGICSKRMQSDQSVNTSLYKPSKSKKMKIGNKKKQTDEANDSISILSLAKENNSVLNYDAMKKLKVYGYFCHVDLSRTYAILQGYTKFLKLKIHLPYQQIQQIRLIHANKKLEQIVVKMVKRKIRFTTKEHIFKDFCHLWNVATTSTIKKRKKLLKSSFNARTEVTAESVHRSNFSKTISLDRPLSNPYVHALSENDAEKSQKQGLAQKSDNDLIIADNDDIDDKDGMTKQQFATNELLSEAPCSTISSALSLSSLTTMIDTPDLEFSIDDNDNMEKCQKSNNNNPTDNNEAEVLCQCESHLGRVLLDEVYPLTTEQLFATLFSATPWYHDLSEIVNKTEHGRMLNTVNGYVATSWMTENSNVPTVTTRTVTYSMSLNNTFGPKSTSVTEKQTCHAFHVADDGFSVTKEIQNSGIPYGDNFIVQCTYCIIRSDNTHSRLLIHGAMVQKKSIWGIIKGIIEKSTYSGLETHYTVLEETLKLLCEGSSEPKQTTVSESEATNNIINNLIPNKLLKGNYINTKSRSVTECNTSTVVHYQTVMLKPIINSAETMNVISTTMNDNNYICDNATEITQRITNDAQTQTFNYFSHNETFNYSNKFIVILISILICLQLFTLLKISYISNIQCADTDANSAFAKAILRQNEILLNAKNLEQLSLTSKSTIFKNDL